MHKLNAHDLIEAMGNVLEQRIRNIVDEQVKHALDNYTFNNSINIADYEGEIEEIVRDFINYNVNVSLEV